MFLCFIIIMILCFIINVFLISYYKMISVFYYIMINRKSDFIGFVLFGGAFEFNYICKIMPLFSNSI